MTDAAQAIRILAAQQTAQILAGSGADASRYLTLAWTIEGYLSGALSRPEAKPTTQPTADVVTLRPVNDAEPA